MKNILRYFTRSVPTSTVLPTESLRVVPVIDRFMRRSGDFIFESATDRKTYKMELTENEVAFRSLSAYFFRSLAAFSRKVSYCHERM